MTAHDSFSMAKRFRGFLPVAVDVETAGFNPQTDALLEIAAVTLRMNEAGRLERHQTFACHVQPFPGANLDPASLAFTGIDPHHPFRDALPELEVLQKIFQPIRKAVRDSDCSRAILVGHNPWFDLAFINAAAQRTGIKRNPFHPFSAFDTATLGGLAFGQTVLARAAQAAGISWDTREAHSAIYDAEQTAELFCRVVNLWEALQGKEDEIYIAKAESQ
jgi:ribonuclease T